MEIELSVAGLTPGPRVVCNRLGLERGPAGPRRRSPGLGVRPEPRSAVRVVQERWRRSGATPAAAARRQGCADHTDPRFIFQVAVPPFGLPL